MSAQSDIDTLSSQTCEACRVGAPTVEHNEAKLLLEQLSGWEIIEQDNIPQLVKTYQFKNFVEAISFTNQIGELAETENHHPAILTEWGKITVRWWTHKIKGLHKNDFICASKTDQL